MHILFIGYGKTSQRVAKQLFQHGHQITTISQTPKTDPYANHLIQDVHQLNLAQVAAIDWVYVLLSPAESSIEGYQQAYVDSVQPILQALKTHPVQKLVLVSSTRVYGENNGARINDDSACVPNDAQGALLLQMEQLYQQAYPAQCIIIRPTGIYGNSVTRMLKLAHSMTHYPHIHYSNQIHIEDLAGFLAHLVHVEHTESSYIVSNNRPLALHETIQWFQRQLNLPLLVLDSEALAGKRVYATRMPKSGFELQHQDCFEDYKQLLAEVDL